MIVQKSEKAQEERTGKTPAISIVRQIPRLGRKMRKVGPFEEPFPEEVIQA